VKNNYLLCIMSLFLSMPLSVTAQENDLENDQTMTCYGYKSSAKGGAYPRETLCEFSGKSYHVNGESKLESLQIVIEGTNRTWDFPNLKLIDGGVTLNDISYVIKVLENRIKPEYANKGLLNFVKQQLTEKYGPRTLTIGLYTTTNIDTHLFSGAEEGSDAINFKLITNPTYFLRIPTTKKPGYIFVGEDLDDDSGFFVHGVDNMSSFKKIIKNKGAKLSILKKKQHKLLINNFLQGTFEAK